jgi:hypothetical protein
MESQFDEFDLGRKEKKANLAKKNAAGLIDAAIYIVIYLVSAYTIPMETWRIIDNDYALLFILSTFFAYRLITIIILNKTLGMKFMKLEFSKEYDAGLSVLEKILAAFMIYINGLDCFEVSKKTEN